MAFLGSGDALAQTASQITPPSYRPPLETPSTGPAVVPQPEALAAPEGAEQLFVTLSGVTVEGGFEALAAATSQLEARLTGVRISGAEIFAAARQLESAYAKAGYVLVRIVLPPQVLVDGARLKLVVVDGFIENIDTSHVPEPVRARIDAILAPLRDRRALTLPEIERRLLLAGDTPGVILRSTLAPGKESGATILVANAQYQPMLFPVTFDNTLSSRLGRWTLGLGTNFNSVASGGELVYLRATGDPNTGDEGFLSQYPRNRALAAGIVLPIDYDGLSVNLESVLARTTPVPVAGVATNDIFERFSARLRYPFVRSRNLDINGEITFDLANETQGLFVAESNIPIARDRVRVLRLVSDGNVLLPWGGLLAARLVASFGLDTLGARARSEASPLLPLSRQFANSGFQKLDVSLAYSQPLDDHLTANFFARGQTSFGQALVQSEQIGIATPTGLSSFNTGTLQGDQGVALRGELASPWTIPALFENIGVVATPYVFGAIGAVYLQYPTIVEQTHRRAAAYGAGLRLAGAFQQSLSNGSLSLEWGQQVESQGLQHGDRFMLVGSINF